MNRQAAIGYARDISDTLLIHLLRRREAGGSDSPQDPPPTPHQLDCVDRPKDPDESQRSWFYRKLAIVEKDRGRPVKDWLCRGPWSNSLIDQPSRPGHLTRLLNLIRKLHWTSNTFHHAATSVGPGDVELKITPDDVQRMLIEPLDELFCRDEDELRPAAQRSRILL